jgi:hypothetical protein
MRFDRRPARAAHDIATKQDFHDTALPGSALGILNG